VRVVHNLRELLQVGATPKGLAVVWPSDNDVDVVLYSNSVSSTDALEFLSRLEIVDVATYENYFKNAPKKTAACG
jgi:hypothetical protein